MSEAQTSPVATDNNQGSNTARVMPSAAGVDSKAPYPRPMTFPSRISCRLTHGSLTRTDGRSISSGSALKILCTLMKPTWLGVSGR